MPVTDCYRLANLLSWMVGILAPPFRRLPSSSYGQPQERCRGMKITSKARPGAMQIRVHT
jgi:hypothetical protein